MSLRKVSTSTASQSAKLALLVFSALLLSGGARAEATHIVQGVFCNTEAQLDRVLAHLQAGLSPRAAVEVGNGQSVDCVLADLIGFVIIRPIIIDTVSWNTTLLKYQATLVGVMVGGNLRPVEPPTQTFFAHETHFPGSRMSA